MKDDEYIHRVTAKCWVCGFTGSIIVRLVQTGIGRLEKTWNKANLCTNSECFRYSARIPDGWILDTVMAYDEEKRRLRSTVYDPRKLHKSYGKPDAETENDGKAALDNKSATVQKIKKPRREATARQRAWNEKLPPNRSEHRNKRQGVRNFRDDEGAYEIDDPMGEQSAW